MACHTCGMTDGRTGGSNSTDSPHGPHLPAISLHPPSSCTSRLCPHSAYAKTLNLKP